MRLRFSIRDLLWLTVVVALAAGWWVDHGAMNNNIVKLQAIEQKAELEVRLQEGQLQVLEDELRSLTARRDLLEGQVNTHDPDNTPIDGMPIVPPRKKQRYP
jgi:hypothetical protein